MNAARTILVSGATGKQGGACVSGLLSQNPNLSIRSLTRNPSSAAALALSKKHPQISLIKGDMLDTNSLTTALQGVDAAFLVTDFTGPQGIAGEIAQGKTFIDAAVASTTVQHIVYTSAHGADMNSGVPHFDSKFQVENYLKASKIPTWTILRPTAFMENLGTKPGGQLFGALGMFANIMQGKAIQFITVEDIGGLGAMALLDPQREEYRNKEIGMTGDVLDINQVQEAYARAFGNGKPWKMYFPDMAIGLLPEDFKLMIKFLKTRMEEYKNIDVDALRRLYPALSTFDQWLERNVKKE